MPSSNKILLVEDNHQDEFLILRNLKKVGMVNPIDVVRDGQQALDYVFCEGEFVARDNSLPILVLLDINLPRVSGLDVLEKLRADPRTKSMPVVMLTSSDDDSDRLQSYRSGCNSFVRKPVDFGEFADAVGRIGVYWCATNIPPNGKCPGRC